MSAIAAGSAAKRPAAPHSQIKTPGFAPPTPPSSPTRQHDYQNVGLLETSNLKKADSEAPLLFPPCHRPRRPSVRKFLVCDV